MKDYNVIKKEVHNYLEKQSKLLPSQKILKEISSLLSNSRRYVDYCNELKNIFNNNVEIFALADFFFIDCSIVFQNHSILQQANILGENKRSISIEKFFNVLNNNDAKKFNDKASIINSLIKTDRVDLQNIRQEFTKFKDKRDKEIAHFDLRNINREYIVSLDLNLLIDIQTRTFDLLEKYFNILSLPNPTKLSDYSSFESFGITTGLETINHVLLRALNELDFSDNQNVSRILKGIKVANAIKRYAKD